MKQRAESPLRKDEEPSKALDFTRLLPFSPLPKPLLEDEADPGLEAIDEPIGPAVSRIEVAEIEADRVRRRDRVEEVQEVVTHAHLHPFDRTPPGIDDGIQLGHDRVLFGPAFRCGREIRTLIPDDLMNKVHHERGAEV